MQTPREPQRRRKLKLAQLRTVQATSWPYRVATGSAASDEATADQENTDQPRSGFQKLVY